MSSEPDKIDHAGKALARLTDRVFLRTPKGSTLQVDIAKKADGPRIFFAISHKGQTGIVYRKPKILELGDEAMEAAGDEIAAQLRKQVGAS